MRDLLTDGMRLTFGSVNARLFQASMTLLIGFLIASAMFVASVFTLAMTPLIASGIFSIHFLTAL